MFINQPQHLKQSSNMKAGTINVIHNKNQHFRHFKAILTTNINRAGSGFVRVYPQIQPCTKY
jgi:hypothetical protein